jgi:hypothetical protein
MPSHQLHRKVSLSILGQAYPDVDRLLDLPGLMGVKHHRRFLHDPLSAFMIGYALHGEKGALAGFTHILLDKVCNDRNTRRLVEAAFR